MRLRDVCSSFMSSRHNNTRQNNASMPAAFEVESASSEVEEVQVLTRPLADQAAAVNRSLRTEISTGLKESVNGERDQGAVQQAAVNEDNENGESNSLYQIYHPKHLNEGFPHPDPIVETASLARVDAPRITYKHTLQDVVARAALSSLQLESILYACMKFDGPRLSDGSRMGFFLGDGAGVGKGRQIAGLVFEQMHRGARRVLWVSVSTDLKWDAERDLADMGAHTCPLVYPKGTAPLPQGKLRSHGVRDGVLFCTYSLLVSGSGKQSEKTLKPANLIRDGSRLKQIIEWLNECKASDPLIVFDECHKAKNLLSQNGTPTKTALAVVAMQQAIPQAKVLYCSATGASEPKNLAYMTRLGTFGYKDFNSMLVALEKAGMGALEMFAMGLKATGAYLCRTLSYSGAEFEVATCELSPEMRIMYDRAAEFWQMLFAVFDMSHGRKGKQMMKAQFWGAHQRFFRQMLLCAKVPTVARMARDAVSQHNMCVVVGLQSTGEAGINKALSENKDDELDEFVSAPMMVVKKLIETQFPTEGPDDLGEDGLAVLFRQLRQVVAVWRDMPSVAAAAASDAPVVTTRRKGNESPEQPASSAQAATEAAPVEAEDSDDDVFIVGEKSFDEVQEERKQHAMRTGNFFDLSEPVSELELEQLRGEEVDVDVPPAGTKTEPQPLEAPGDRAFKMRKVEPAQQQRCSSEVIDVDSDVDSQPSIEDLTPEPIANETRDGAPALQATVESAPKTWLHQRVRVRGVQMSPEINGRVGTCKELDAHSLRWLVHLDPHPGDPSSRQVLLRDQNLELVDQGVGANENLPPGGASASDLTEAQVLGRRISLHGLVSAAAYNGRTGVCERRCAVSGRMHVLLDDDEDTERDDPNRWAKVHLKNIELLSQMDLSDDAGQSRETPTSHPPTSASRSSPAIRSSRPARASAQTHSAHTSDRAPQDYIGKVVQLVGLRFAPHLNGRSGLARTMDNATGRVIVDLHAVVPRFGEDFPQQSAETVKVKGVNIRLRGPDDEPDSAPTTEPTLEGGGTSGPPACSSRPARKRKATAFVDPDSEVDEEEACSQEAAQTEDISNPWLRKIKLLLLKALPLLELPPNPIDHFTELCGGSDCVAEMTGRIRHQMHGEDGRVEYVRRCPGIPEKLVNMKERESFQKGDKLVAIISDAASTGISLQADRRAANQRRRLHMTLELPWSADKAIQQFGRSHRSNQVSAPVYRILVTPVGGERRFASAAAKRLQSLGALLKGDRRALGAGVDLKEFDVDNKYGQRALRRMYVDLSTGGDPMNGVVAPRMNNGVDFTEHGTQVLRTVGMDVHKQATSRANSSSTTGVGTFLNRLLGLTIKDQQLLFEYFANTLEATIKEAKADGSFDDGIVAISAERIEIAEGYPNAIHTDPASGATTNLLKLDVDRGMSAELAMSKLATFREHNTETDGRSSGPGSGTGFWISTQTRNACQTHKPLVVLATEKFLQHRHRTAVRYFSVRRPGTGSLSCSIMDMNHLRNNYRMATIDEAEPLWRFWHAFHLRTCSHGPNCYTKQRTGSCSNGTRNISVMMVTGAILPVWQRLQRALQRAPMTPEEIKRQGRVIRTETTSGQRIVGINYDEQLEDLLTQAVQEDTEYTDTEC